MTKRNGGRRGSPLLGALVFLATLAAAGYFWFQYSASSQKKEIALLVDISSRLRSETVPVKFMVLSRDGGEIKARVRLYDLARREIAVVEKSWPGSELYVDMLLIPFRSEARKRDENPDSWLAFPYRIFTDGLPAASGTILFDTYDSGGFPDVMRGIEWSAKEKAVLASAFATARRKAAAGLPAADSAKGAYGSAVHEVSKLSRFEPGIVYKVVCRVKGGVEIMED
jgi:hypothetical protein